MDLSERSENNANNCKGIRKSSVPKDATIFNDGCIGTYQR